MFGATWGRDALISPFCQTQAFFSWKGNVLWNGKKKFKILHASDKYHHVHKHMDYNKDRTKAVNSSTSPRLSLMPLGPSTVTASLNYTFYPQWPSVTFIQGSPAPNSVRASAATDEVYGSSFRGSAPSSHLFKKRWLTLHVSGSAGLISFFKLAFLRTALRVGDASLSFFSTFKPGLRCPLWLFQ